MSILDTAEYRRLALIAAGVDPCDIPCILDTAAWRRLMLKALYDLSQGGGGSPGYINGSVQFYTDLPVTVGTPAVNTAYLVRENSGVWFINRKPAGIYVRLFNNGNLNDWDYAGTFPEVNDAQYFRIYDSADPTREVAFNVSGISSGTTRTVTMPDADVMLPDQGTSTTNAPSFTGLTVNGTSDTSPVVTIYGAQWFGSVNGNQGVLYQGDIAGKVKVIALNRAFSQYKTLELVSDGNVFSFPSGGGTLARTSDIPAAFDPASPGTIGATTPAAATFTNLTANTRLNLPNTNGTTAGDIYRTTDMLRYRDSSNTERILLNNLDNLANLGNTATARTNIGLGSASDVTFGSLQNTPIGSTTRNSGAFTTLSSNVGTITASTPLAVTQTWNNSATNFRAIETNITNTASQTESYHLLCNVGGSLVAYIRRDGRIVAGANVYGGAGLESALLPQGVAVGNASYIGFCSNTFANDSGGDLRLFRDAADTLAQRRSTNPQTFRLYNTFTSATNFERLNIIAQSAASVIIGTEKGSGGGTARGLELRTDNVARITIGSAGQIGFFGATAAAQPTAVADATDAATVITQLNALLSRLRTIGLIAT